MNQKAPTTLIVYGNGPQASRIAEMAALADVEVRLLGDGDDDGLREAGLVVEAADDTPEAKRAGLQQLAERAPRAIIATTTTVQSVTALAAHAADATRVGGLHFVDLGRPSSVVEVVRAQRTSNECVAALVGVIRALGKEPIEVKDRPGFLVHRLLFPYLNDVIQCYDDGLASARDLDVALELGLGYPQGALGLLDKVGLDVHLARTRAIHDALGDRHFAPPPLLVRMAQAGELGAGSSRGFRIGDPTEDGQ